MTARGPSVELREVAPGEREAFFAMLADYLAELDAYELPWDPAPPVEAYREAIDADPDGQQIEWVVADGERSGFLITRVVPDWPEEAREVGEVIESYVEVEQRGRGVGRAAVEIWLARMRAQGVTRWRLRCCGRILRRGASGSGSASRRAGCRRHAGRKRP